MFRIQAQLQQLVELAHANKKQNIFGSHNYTKYDI